jgi:hypothetical protein
MKNKEGSLTVPAPVHCTSVNCDGALCDGDGLSLLAIPVKEIYHPTFQMSLKYILHARVFRNSEALYTLLLDICKDLRPFLPIPRTDPGPFILL